MEDAQLIKNFTVQEQAYLIVVGLTGNQTYNATYEELKDEDCCQQIVDHFWNNCNSTLVAIVANHAHNTIHICPNCGQQMIFKCSNCGREL